MGKDSGKEPRVKLLSYRMAAEGFRAGDYGSASNFMDWVWQHKRFTVRDIQIIYFDKKVGVTRNTSYIIIKYADFLENV